MKPWIRRTFLILFFVPLVLGTIFIIIFFELLKNIWIIPDDIYSYAKQKWIEAKEEMWNPFDYK